MSNPNNLTLGSLFDGSGGFPLGGIMVGIRPVWASEIEPFAIRVTSKRMPYIKHYGDISQMDGAKIEPVDIITFGSPCQDMSVAGKRSGLDGSRSSLFYEAIRIIKEMRRATNGEKPRYIVWENVPGAFSSNNGYDFKAVLESLVGIVEEKAEMPMPEKSEWAYADCLMGDGWSIAYRVFDAQYWGVPQRRRRIYLVADFAGRSTGEILFKSEGLSGYSAEGFRAWQRIANGFENSVGKAGVGFDGYNGSVDEKAATLGVNCGMSSGRNGVVLNDQGGSRMDVSEKIAGTLRASSTYPPCIIEDETASDVNERTVSAALCFENHSQDTRYIGPVYVSQTLSGQLGTGGNNQPFVVTPKTLKIRSGKEGGGKGALIQDDKSATLATNNDQTLFVPFCKRSRAKFKGDATTWTDGKVANTLNNFDVGEGRCNELAVAVPQCWDGQQVAPTLTKQNAGGSQRMPDKDNFNCVLEPFGISAKDSNAMKSDNPHSGIYKAETARTIDTSGGNPSCNQGGIAVVCVDKGGGKSACGVTEEKTPTLACTHGGEPAICIQGSMIGRKDKNGPQGSGINEEKAFTLNVTDRHAVFGIGRDAFNQGQNAKYKPAIEEEVQPTLVAKGPGAIAEVETQGDYTVRRLTPTECARLQGFPDWWCSDLGTERPTDEEVYFWYKVFETYRRITGSGKPKTDKQLRSWLKDPYSDSAEYKLWGNGVALPCVFYVLSGIVWAYKKCEKI